jgi:hypothetical protein
MSASFDRYSGDPRLLLTANGADLDYRGGQPVMDQGLENCAILSLFTRSGWCGNIFLDDAEKIGSDYEETCEGPITLSRLADIENSAERALSTTKAFGRVSAHAANPQAARLMIDVTLGPGGSLSLTREKALWTAQIKKPAYRRLDKTYA